MESIGQEILLCQNSFLLFGRTIVWIKSLEGVCLKKNKGFSSMKMSVEDILLHKRKL